MAVETVTNIGDLDPATPTGAAPKSEGDNHIKNIKAALRRSFAGFVGAVFVTGVDGGSANAYTLEQDDAGEIFSYAERMMVVFRPVANNTGAATLDIAGLGPKPIVSVAGVPLVAGDITAGRYYTAFYDGTKFRLDNVTQNYVDQLVISGTVPGANEPTNAGKVFSTDGATGQWISLDGRGDPVFDNGSVATGTVVINYAKGEGQKVKATGSHTLAVTGFPVGRLAGILLVLSYYGAYAIASAGITWIKSDNTETGALNQSGITFPASGRARVVLYSMGDGVVYGKAA